MKWLSYSALLFTLAFLAVADAGERSESKIKASASAGKIGADGKQVVTITLEIEKGWYIYANPIHANTEVLKPNQTEIKFKSGGALKADIQFPKGKQKAEGKYRYDVYEGKITIPATVRRPAGDTAALQVRIDVNTCRKGECLLPGTVKLTVP